MNGRAILPAASLVLVVGLAASSSLAQSDNTRRGLTRGGGQQSQPAQDPPPQQAPAQAAPPPPPPAPTPAQTEPSRPAQAPSSGMITPRLPAAPGAGQQYRRANGADGTVRRLTPAEAKPAPRAPRLSETVRMPSGIETSREARAASGAAFSPAPSTSQRVVGRRMFGGTPHAASAAGVPAADTFSPAFDHTRRGLVRAVPPPVNSGNGNSNDDNGPGNYDPPRRGRRDGYGRSYYRPITTVYALPSLFGPIPSIAGGWADTSQFGYRDYGGFTYPPLFGPQYAQDSVQVDGSGTFDWYGHGLYAWDNSSGYGPEPYVIEIPSVAGGGDAAAPTPVAAQPFTVGGPTSASPRASTRINTAYDVTPDFHVSVNAVAQGEFSTAIFAMRRAAGVNPAALVGTQSTISPSLAEDLAAAERVRFALRTFQNPPQRVVSEADAKFMVAALHGALGDRQAAAAAARSALAAGDSSLSTMLLDRAIRGERLDDSGPWVTGRPLVK